MAKGMYLGDPITGLAKKIKKLYIGDPSTGVARKVKKVYIGDPNTGVARLCWSGSNIDIVTKLNVISGVYTTDVFITEDRKTFTKLGNVPNSYTVVGTYCYDSNGNVNSDIVYIAFRYGDASYLNYYLYAIDRSAKTLTFLKNCSFSYLLRDFVNVDGTWLFLDSGSSTTLIRDYNGSQIGYSGIATSYELTMTDKDFLWATSYNKYVYQIDKKTGQVAPFGTGTVSMPLAGGYINNMFYYIANGIVYYSTTPTTGFSQKVLNSSTMYMSNYTATGNGASVAICYKPSSTDRDVFATRDGINFTYITTTSNSVTVKFDGVSFKIPSYYGYLVSEDGFNWTTVPYTGLSGVDGVF